MITILGPTACGKTSLAAALAAQTDGEIISADSRQVYRRMDIGTGKDLADYTVDGKAIPYHLIDIAEPGTRYNLFRYQQDFTAAYRDITARGRLPILCGGTGLYIEAVVKAYRLPDAPEDPVLRAALEGKSLDELTRMLLALKQHTGTTMHNQTDIDTPQRAIRAIEVEMATAEARENPAPEVPRIDNIIIGVDIPRDLRRQRITDRLRQRLDEGMVDEIRSLIRSGVKPENLMYYGLEYRYITEYATGQTTYGEMYTRLETAIHQFAKRQMTWFRGMERRGATIHWIDGTQPMEAKVSQIITLWHNSKTAGA